MKRILTTICALAIILAGSVAALAAEDTGRSAGYYPISVEEYTCGDFDEPRINKVYQLSLADDPSRIPTEDFVRGGRLYYLLDMTRKDEVGVDIQTRTQTVTLSSDTDDLQKILGRLDARMEVATEDGYTGVLVLDHTSVNVTTDGYATKTQSISATRTYPNLSDADTALIPKTIEDQGRTLTLNDVTWSSSAQAGEDGAVRHYTATAKYGGAASSRYATGYTVTADYTGQVAKTDCSVVTYTAVFGSVEASEKTELTDAPDTVDTSDTVEESVNLSGLKRPLLIGGAALVLVGGCAFAFKKFRERR